MKMKGSVGGRSFRQRLEEDRINAEYHVYATNDWGNRKLVAWGDKEEVEGFRDLVKPECKVKIVRNK